jgi:hypothetical protein
MTIRLDLSRHCIETALKRCHNAAISRYFNVSNPSSDLEDEIELLGQALKTFDFNYLRSHYRPLAGHSAVIVRLTQGSAGQPTLTFEGVSIVPPDHPAECAPAGKGPPLT